jgi:hypothetical protein
MIWFAVVVVTLLILAVIVTAIFASPMFSMNFNQTNPDNNNFNSLSLNLPDGILHRAPFVQEHFLALTSSSKQPWELAVASF